MGRWSCHLFNNPVSSSLFRKLFLLLCVCSITQIEALTGYSDKSVLLQLKNSLSDESGLLSSWSSNSSDHCSWFGILCDFNSRVISLYILGNGGGEGKKNSSAFSCSDFSIFPLYGLGIRRNCAGSRGKLSGSVSPVISELSELRNLSLPFNGFVGEVPTEIWAMKSLEVLDLEGNSITGILPDKFSGLRNLRVLNLGFNSIQGGIPASLSSCFNLEILNLAGNQFNGTIPGFLSQLKGVYMSFNSFTGSIPSELGDDCGKLEHLDLSGNWLVQGIPSSLGNCSQLQALLLYSNMLEEGIPSEIGKLQKLKVLDISRNSLSGSIPPQLGNCSELSVLVLSNLFQVNNTYGNSPLDGMSNEISTDEYNFFQGEIPEGISILPKLRILWAPRVILEGRFPSNWGRCESLEVINLAQNLLSGELPRGLSQCKKLQFLDLSSNRLSGPLNQDLPVPCMTFSDISGNKMVGPIPVFSKNPCPPVSYSLNKFSFESDHPFSQYLWFFATRARASNKLPTGDGDSLVVFHNFGQNKFSGSLQSLAIAPERLGKQTVYAYLAGGNKLTGPFPRILLENCGGLKALIVNVSNNKISGPIPGEIGEMCASLKILDASENQINGSIPSSFGKLSLDVINLSWNLLQSGIPFSLGRIATLKYLSLAHNNLKGPIPSSLGQLHVLQSLDLSSNSLTGEIPQDVVKLRSLTLLLLNNNKLSGQIPDGLANVFTLSSFNVSFNNLSGSLPSNNNLMKCSSVLGNPLLQPCRMFSLTVPSSDLASSNLSASPSNDPTPSSGNGSGMNSIEIASITSASAIVSVLLALIVLFIYSRKWKPRSKIHGSSKKEVIVFTDIGVQLTFENVVQATNNFNASNCIGSGGFGATYKAEISPGVVVAIKRLSVGRFQGVQQFRTEVKTLGRLRHPNLVTLIGYHASETEMFLIYNFLPRGNLEKFIRERSTRAIDWRILHKIAFDIAQALTYLHDECIPRVLHRDVKPSNILIDDDFNAYLSDFGLARLLGTSETHATTGVAGTFGYVAPEYAMTCRVSDKADVYSYGVVLLELLSDKKALDPSFSSYGNGFNIVALACMLLRQGRAKEFFTAGLWEVGPHDDLVEMLHLAVVCTVDSLSYRPTMKQVVRRLKQLQPPSC